VCSIVTTQCRVFSRCNLNMQSVNIYRYHREGHTHRRVPGVISIASATNQPLRLCARKSSRLGAQDIPPMSPRRSPAGKEGSRYKITQYFPPTRICVDVQKPSSSRWIHETAPRDPAVLHVVSSLGCVVLRNPDAPFVRNHAHLSNDKSL